MGPCGAQDETRPAFRVHFTGGDECDGQRRNLWLGCCCSHHSEGQGDHPHAENQDGLKQLLQDQPLQVLSSDILCVPILDPICRYQHLPGKFLSKKNVPISEKKKKKKPPFKKKKKKKKKKK